MYANFSRHKNSLKKKGQFEKNGSPVLSEVEYLYDDKFELLNMNTSVNNTVLGSEHIDTLSDDL